MFEFKQKNPRIFENKIKNIKKAKVYIRTVGAKRPKGLIIYMYRKFKISILLCIFKDLNLSLLMCKYFNSIH